MGRSGWARVAAVAAAVLTTVGLAPVAASAGAGAPATPTSSALLRGTVQYADGSLVAGATVDVLARDDALAVVASADTDAAGAYAIPVPPGHYDVRVELPGAGVRLRQTTPDVDVSATRVLTIVVRRGAADVRLRGVVHDRAGAGLPGISLWFVQGTGGPSAQTDGTGHFDTTVPAGDYDLHVRSWSGYEVVVALHALADRTLDLTLPTRTVSATVLDPGGAPVADAVVQTVTDAPPVDVADVLPGVAGTGTMFSVYGITDANGLATVTVLDTTSPFALEAHPSTADLGTGSAEVAAGAGTVTITVPASVPLTGVVRNAAGAPVPEAEVLLLPDVGGYYPPGTQITYADEAGNYRFDATPGAYRVVTQSDDGLAEGVLVSLSAAMSQDLTLPATTPLSVTVVDHAGTPVPWAWVTARTANYTNPPGVGDSGSTAGSTDLNGHVSLTMPVAGDLVLDVNRPDGFTQSVTVSGRNPVTVTLDPAVPVTGVVTLGGVPLSGAWLQLGGAASAVTGSDGSFSLMAPSGSWPVGVSGFSNGLSFSLSGLVNVGSAARRVTLAIPVGHLEVRSAGVPMTFMTASANTFNAVDATFAFDLGDGPARGQWGRSSALPPGTTTTAVDVVASGPVSFYLGSTSATVPVVENATVLFAAPVADDQPPTIAAAVTPAPSADGWNRGPVTVGFTCADDQTLVSCPVSVPVAGPTADTPVSGVAVDAAGNRTRASVDVRIDGTAPTISVNLPPTPASGWFNGDVTASFTCADDVSGVASCPAPVTLSGEGSAVPVSGTVTDRAGNTATVSAAVAIDRTPPSIVASVDPASAAGGAWTAASPVTVSFACADTLSGVGSCPAPVTVSDEGATTVSGTALDVAGNSAGTSVTVRIDRSAPTATPSLPAGAVNGWYATSPVVVPLACVDVLSGVASCPAAVFTTDGAGQSRTVTVSDLVGNTAAVTVSGVNIDTVAPDTAMAARQSPSHGERVVTGTAGDATSGVDHVAVTFTGSGGATTVSAPVTCPSGPSAGCTWSVAVPVARGRWDVSAAAVDVAGNVDPTPAAGTYVG